MTVGTVVIVKAGKEKGKPFVVTEIVSERSVRIADGKRRPLERPKLKNIIHLQRTNTVIDEITTDRQLRQFLTAFQSGG